MIIGLVGFISCGKDTVADYLVTNYSFKKDAYANSLKDVVAALFNWDREMLDGNTRESRIWRETVDEWWSARLNRPFITPRRMLQQIGTEIFRDTWNQDIWVAGLENRLVKTQDNLVISDVRFQNEIAAIKKNNGIIVRIKRGIDPIWYDDAVILNTMKDSSEWLDASNRVSKYNVHISEMGWIGRNYDYEVENNGAIEELYTKIDAIVSNASST